MGEWHGPRLVSPTVLAETGAMGAYNGSAVIVVVDVEYPCRASLRSGHEMVPDPTGGPPLPGLVWWKGVVEVEDSGEGAFAAINRADAPLLRIGGREGTFLPDGGTWPRLQITGNNLPPFD